MDEAAIREPAQIGAACALKLDVAVPPGPLRGLVGCLCERNWGFAEIAWANDGGLVARCPGELTFRHYLGPKREVILQIHAAAQSARLDGDEIGHLLGRAALIRRAP